ncbi:lactase/phlorizin hydrolase-like [Boleophthalmus pectinirostris]|uniref:lactase/phlorizin hydrolase-like n=1 Tax=Boleophthalmus pectinirostris TaxID=150288 RepID=UPI00242CD05E|nr:lactase/phlorizin hydrolase-like [Boleophthalmus pectinirostris]
MCPGGRGGGGGGGGGAALLLLVVLCCSPYSSGFLMLGGPRLLHSSDGALASVCSRLLDQNLQEELRTQRGTGVTHFRTQLPPELLHTDHREDLSCLQTLLDRVLQADLQPVLFVDLSVVFTGSRPGPDLEQRLDVLFEQLGGQVRTWILLLSSTTVREQQFYAELQRIFRRHFPHEDHVLSLGVKSRDLSSLPELRSDLPVDFFSVELHHDCDVESAFGDTIANIKRVSGPRPVLIYSIHLDHCTDHQQVLGNLLTGTNNRFRSDVAPRSGASFPAGFQWGVSSAAFKVEGGWREGGKGETIWDRHQTRHSADVACDSYNKVPYDVSLLRGLGVDSYHFSISWARIFPTGTGSASEDGALYYDSLIDALLASGIRPLVSLFHWDLPQTLQESGGWTDPSIVQAFRDYADFCFSRYGDRVQDWITFSSPWTVSHAGYGTGEHPPWRRDYQRSAFQATHNLLKAHAEAWHLYDQRYRATQRGEVGIALNSDWAQALDPNNPEDQDAAQRYLQMMLGWFAHPIFVDGDYPPELKSQVELKAKECPGNPPAVLPQFSAEEKLRLKGTADFFGLTHYTSRLVSHKRAPCGGSGPEALMDYQTHVDPTWTPTASDWIYLNPGGLRSLLKDISEKYLRERSVPLYLTGVGMPTGGDAELLQDTTRAEFIRRCVDEALKAIVLDKVDLRRFTVESLLDGFEGAHGYSQRFGLHYVDFTSPDRPRTPKTSAYVYSQIIEQNRAGDGLKAARSPPPVSFTPGLKNLPASQVPSQASVVWEKFSHWTEYHNRLYHFGTFPSNFLWGVMSSAYQVEGAWNTEGKGPSIWDNFTHTPGHGIPEDGNGDVTCDSYNKLNEDINLIKALGVKSYRFSISWSRIFPDGMTTTPNAPGVAYYNSLINSLVGLGVAPVVTLYHWDLPQALQNIGGWENNQIIQYFNAYADFCFKTFGDRVKFWITFNDPFSIAWKGYGSGELPPKLTTNPGMAPYTAAHNLILAHATVYKTYATYRPTQKGLVSIALHADWYEPLDVNTPRELEAADRAMQFRLGWFAHPIFKNGDYPEAMKFHVGNKSEIQGLAQSRLPTFTPEQMNLVKGAADVFCINHQTTKKAKYAILPHDPPSYGNDWDVVEEEMWQFPVVVSNGPRMVPWGLRRVLNWVKEEYGNPEVYVTENSMLTVREMATDDFDRVFFLKTYIDETLKAQAVDGVRVSGYVGVPLMDSFEWMRGFIMGSGLYQVDFTNPVRPRTQKYAANYYMDIVKNNGFPAGPDDTPLYNTFRDDMQWSSATASFQIEGGWRDDGKGLNIWDKFSHTPDKVKNGDTGDVACDSYHRTAEDVSMLQHIGVKYYRFSISWSRVLPDGTTAHINEPGVQYYVTLVDTLLQAGIQPQITLYHWDLPQALEDIGGWQNVSMVKYFTDYADLMFTRLGPKVKRWITFNEPYIVANLGYGYGVFAPGVNNAPGEIPYVVAHHLIKAHAEAWHLYNDKYRASQGGEISITLNADWAEPRNPHKQDITATYKYVEFFLGWFAHPIYIGDYSQIMKDTIRNRSLAQGYTKSRLPEFTPEEIQRIKGTHDYFGLNHYTTKLIFPINYAQEDPTYDADRGVGAVDDWSWLESGSSWLKVTPFGIRRLLKHIKDTYGNPQILITENGVSEKGTVDLNDLVRQYYYNNYINQVLKARVLDGADVRGYTAWSLMDNFEWAEGYGERFGLFFVNRSDAGLPRTPKVSVQTYSTIIRCNGFVDPNSGHPCLQAPVLTTTAQPVTFAPLNILGMKLSPAEAETGFNTTFALMIISFAAALGGAVGIFMMRRKHKD